MKIKPQTASVSRFSGLAVAAIPVPDRLASSPAYATPELFAAQNTRVGEVIARKRAERLRQVAAVAPSKLKLFRHVFEGKASPRQAVKAACLECVAYDEAEVRACTAPACPLWNLRPFQRCGAR